MAGRPREFDRDEALIKARNFFWLHGYEGTSISDLVNVLGIASARIYKAFGSKEALFREAVIHYETNEGGFALIALHEKDIMTAITQMLTEAVNLYTRKEHAMGCMVVSSANALSEENHSLLEWMTTQRIERGKGIITRFEQAKTEKQLSEDANPQLLGQYFSLILHGLSVQARDGASRETLMDVVNFSLRNLVQFYRS
ncbi:TetR/AcrR family transcriptional regulator [Providencia sp. Je.9.19]|uniref:TetR/AcrR family transcriptional regulator n=1 Tax=unclassified Providencia TaxID=2633465 RepID=UPI003DA9200E